MIFTIAEDDLAEVTEQMATGRIDAGAGAGPAEAAPARRRQPDHRRQSDQHDHGHGARPGDVSRTRKNELFPNQFVNARLLVKTLTQVNLVPQAAIQRNNDVAFVYVVQPDSTVKSRTSRSWPPRAKPPRSPGVNAGDQLVTDGFDKLQNGSKVVAQARAAQSGRAAPAADGGAAKTSG